MNVELAAYTPDAEKLCGMAAATCTASKDWEKSLKSALASGHTSVLEHASYTFSIKGVSRALLAQLSRHRLMSLSVQSQRYVRESALPDGWVDYATPSSIETNENALKEYKAFMRDAMSLYMRMISCYGIPTEDARMVLPNAAYTNLMLTVNARELRHIASLRTCRCAQTEIRDLVTEMVRLAGEATPMLMENAGPPCLTTGRCPEGKRSCGRLKSKQNDKTQECAF